MIDEKREPCLHSQWSFCPVFRSYNMSVCVYVRVCAWTVQARVERGAKLLTLFNGITLIKQLFVKRQRTSACAIPRIFPDLFDL